MSTRELKDIRREYVKKQFTGNLGRVVEKDDKIICYVDKKKCKKDQFVYILKCRGIPKSNAEFARMYGLDKEIVYVLDGFSMKKDSFYILGSDNCKIVVRNSIFRDFKIYTEGNCFLDNVQSRSISPLLIEAKNISINNCSLSNYLSFYGIDSLVKIDADDKLHIKDSLIGKNDDVSKVDIISDNNINIKNSRLLGNEIVCSAKNMDIDEDSWLIANQEIVFNAEDLEDFNAEAPKVVHDISNNKDYRKLEKVRRG